MMFIGFLFFVLFPMQLWGRVLEVPDNYQTIQTAIDSAQAGDTVLVAPGRYRERITFRGRNIVVGSRYILRRDDESIRSTIIDGESEGRVVSFVSGEGENCRLVGFTITGGLTNYGGGIYIRESSPTLERLVIVGNQATNNGGGIYATRGSSPILSFVTISNNTAQNNGGSVWTFENSTITVENSIFYFNTPTNLQDNVLQITFSDIQGGYQGEGNINDDPLFVNRNGGDYRLRLDSPCVDAADPDAERDPDGSRADMGALFYTRFPVIGVAPEELDFGQVTIGRRAQRQLEIANVGQNRLIGDVPYITPEDAPFDIQDGEEAFEIDPGDNIFLTIIFTPQDTGQFRAALVIPNNDPQNRLLEVPLTGAGIPPYPRVEISPNELVLEAVPLRQERRGNITIINSGDATLSLDSLWLEGNEDGWFRFDNQPSRQVEAGDTAVITIVCRPLQFGERTIVLHFTTNDPEHPHIQISIFAVGVRPEPHFVFVDNTGVNHSILVLSAMVDDSLLSFGSEIGVFDQDNHCYGAGLWQRERMGLAAWGDNIMTEERDGFVEGDSLFFRFYDIERDTELVASVEWVEGDRVYVDNGLSIVRLTATLQEGGEEPPPQGFTLRMNSGWNLISSPSIPEVQDVRVLWRPLVERRTLVILKDGSGRFYAPAYGYSNMPPWDYRYGYFAKLSTNDTLLIPGEIANQETPIPCREGWNLVAYLPEASLSAPQAFARIRDYLEIAKDGSGRFYVPRLGFSNMLPLRRGLGYFAKVSRSLELVWNVPQGMPAPQSLSEGIGKFYRFVPQTPYNMSLLLVTGKEDFYVQELAVKRASGEIVGIASGQEGPPWGIAVWEDDPETEELEGAVEGEPIAIWGWDGTRELALNLEWWEGEGVYHRDQLAVAQITALSPAPNPEITVTPNPFNGEAVVSVSLERAGPIRYSLIDLTGREVLTRDMGDGSWGVNRFFISVPHLPAGVFLLRVITPTEVKTIKLAIVK